MFNSIIYCTVTEVFFKISQGKQNEIFSLSTHLLEKTQAQNEKVITVSQINVPTPTLCDHPPAFSQSSLPNIFTSKAAKSHTHTHTLLNYLRVTYLVSNINLGVHFTPRIPKNISPKSVFPKKTAILLHQPQHRSI